jgi:hypothetical protein
MVALANERELIATVRSQLATAGWRDTDLIVQPLVRTASGFARPALVAMIEGYPVATFDIPGKDATSDDLRNDSSLPFVLESDGLVTKPIIPDASSARARNAVSIDELMRWQPVPTPRDLWTALGRDWTQGDPRLAPLLSDQPPLRFAQAHALGRLLDVIVAGRPRALVAMDVGTGRYLVSLQFAHKMAISGRARRILFIEETRARAEHIARFTGALKNGVPEGNALVGRLEVALRSTIAPEFSILRNPADYDLVVVSETRANDPLEGQFPAATFVSFSTHALGFDGLGLPVAEVSVEDFVGEEEPAVPDGYRAVRLGDIAEVRSGSHRTKNVHDASAAERSVIVLTGRTLETDGSWAPSRADRRPLADGDENDRGRIRRGDILVSAMASPGKLRWTIVPEGPTNDIRIANSVLRIRVTDASIRPQDVAAFLASERGYSALSRLMQTTAGYLRFSPSALTQTLVHVPLPSALPSPPATPTAFALSQLRETILPELINAELSPAPEEVSAVAARTAARLRLLANTLSPPPLLERVVEAYPFPIARAYRQLHDARFNAYEHVLRLRDAFEATAFFVYNVLLADAARRLPRRFYAPDKGTRRAFNGYSMAARISFVEHILRVGASQTEDLFIPELAGTNFVAHARHLQKEFRNHISHTATASESQQRALFSKFAPTVDAMLTELGFLSDYRLVRITSYFVKNRQFVRRMEVYRGVATQIEENALAEEEDPTRAEHDHLVLLDADNEFLDLFPMYQLLACEETWNENHVCYLKQRDGETLEGESAHTSIPLTLSGYEHFLQLVAKLEQSEGN